MSEWTSSLLLSSVRCGGVCCVWGVVGPPWQPFLVSCDLVRSVGVRGVGTRTGAVQRNTNGNDSTDKNDNLSVTIILIVIIFSL